MSKSFIRSSLGGGLFSSYDDPRLGTLAALRRRGIKPEAIRRVILEVGVKPIDAALSYANLAAENRKLVDPSAPRVMFVSDPVKLRVALENAACVEAELPYHPDNRSMGSRSYTVCNGDLVAVSSLDAEELAKRGARLMGLGNFRAEGGKLVELGGGVEEAKRIGLSIIHWVKVGESVDGALLKPSGNALEVIRGLVERKPIEEGPVRVGEVVQLVRVGFARLDARSPLAQFVFAHE